MINVVVVILSELSCYDAALFCTFSILDSNHNDGWLPVSPMVGSSEYSMAMFFCRHDCGFHHENHLHFFTDLLHF